LTDKAFALWSAPLEQFWLDGLVITTSPAFAKLFQGHSVAALAAFRPVANPAVDAFRVFCLFSPPLKTPAHRSNVSDWTWPRATFSEWNDRT